jgi:hypothetical protein
MFICLAVYMFIFQATYYILIKFEVEIVITEFNFLSMLSCVGD